MCNRYNIKGTTTEIVEHFFSQQSQAVVVGACPQTTSCGETCTPGLLLNLDGERELVPMQFGLAKIGAEEPLDRKYPNNNARIKKYNSSALETPIR